jgi:hypothetical protein
MYGYILQDWITPIIDTAAIEVVQSESDWMSFQPFQDIVFWLEARSVANGGANSIRLHYETSPSKDFHLFQSMTSVELVSGQGIQVTVSPVIMNSPNTPVPLARWVRWRLERVGDATQNWGACFRIHCAANAVGVLP